MPGIPESPIHFEFQNFVCPASRQRAKKKYLNTYSGPGDVIPISIYWPLYWHTLIIAFKPRTSTYLSVVQWKVGTFANTESVEFDPYNFIFFLLLTITMRPDYKFWSSYSSKKNTRVVHKLRLAHQVSQLVSKNANKVTQLVGQKMQNRAKRNL